METASLTHEVTLTDAAVAKVKSLLEQEGRDDLRLRVGVAPGGCSGLIYQLEFDDELSEDDAVRDFDGVELVVDKMSVPYLAGATVDFQDTLAQTGFVIDNPNAVNTCSCGGSFH
ncbi:iron-sulfur cluster insertion protein ErpA [uncultured Mobiluncus sp.]|uniref:iron-sulfur cluster insertion protein ErpA n=1 Tax=uncultured Mobiluncus sp. TaxID=293425 RepID=UPI00262ECA98|nr:iron-sulfur cluster insertion protein ErpA [uncultured Mobiluncus sp.]